MLFGSVAKGGETDETDVDLLVVSKKHLSKALDESIGKILMNGFVPEILNFTDAEFNKDEGIKLR